MATLLVFCEAPADSETVKRLVARVLKRSPKRVLEALTTGEHDREKLCWTEAPLSLLRTRGHGSGLVSFLDEATAGLVPLFTGGPTGGPQRK